MASLSQKLLHCAQHDDVGELKVTLDRELKPGRVATEFLKTISYEKSGDTIVHVAARYGSMNTLRCVHIFSGVSLFFFVVTFYSVSCSVSKAPTLTLLPASC